MLLTPPGWLNALICDIVDPSGWICSNPAVFNRWGAPPLGGAKEPQGRRDTQRKNTHLCAALLISVIVRAFISFKMHRFLVRSQQKSALREETGPSKNRRKYDPEWCVSGFLWRASSPRSPQRLWKSLSPSPPPTRVSVGFPHWPRLKTKADQGCRWRTTCVYFSLQCSPATNTSAHQKRVLIALTDMDD